MTKLLPENAFSICQVFNIIDYRSIMRGEKSYTEKMFDILSELQEADVKLYEDSVFEANKREKELLEKTSARLSNVIKQQEKRMKKIQR